MGPDFVKKIQLNVLFKRSKWTQQKISFGQSNTFLFIVILVGDKFWSINTEVNQAVFTTGQCMGEIDFAQSKNRRGVIHFLFAGLLRERMGK